MGEKTFNALRAKYAAATAAVDAYRLSLVSKYGVNFQTSWLATGPRKKLEALRAKTDKIEDQFFALLDAISPRNWRSGVACWWVVAELTYADAVTRGELAPLPHGVWIHGDSAFREFARPVAGGSK